MLNKTDFEEITNAYYSNFCSTDISLAGDKINLICSDRRDEKINGYGCKFGLYILKKDDKVFISYAPKYKEFVENEALQDSERFLDRIIDTYQLEAHQLMVFRELRVKEFGAAIALQKEHYGLYETFFLEENPECESWDWLKDYFYEKTEKGLFTGFIKNEKLVCVCDAPDMPFLQDKIQHTGIATLKEERRKGYATCTAGLATHNLLERGLCPQWECKLENIASIELAKRVGYEKYGVAYILKEWDQ